MLDIGGWELLVIAAVALIVVGPKELPVLVRNVGRWVAKARNLAREFQSGMEAAAKEAELDKVREAGGALRDDLERNVRDLGRLAEEDLDDEPSKPAAAKPAATPAKPAAAAPKPDRVEPGFDEDGMDDRWRGARDQRYAERVEPEARDYPTGRGARG